MKKILSIIIPTYNMEKYLNKCLDSLIVENMHLLEVLVINDGSKDRSSAIAHGYQEKYPDTFRVIDKENGNYGSCINRGLKEATGKYVKVLDADDSFDRDNFRLFLDKLTSLDVDMVLTDYVKVDEQDKVTESICYFISQNKVLSFEESIARIVSSIQMHAVTYLRQNLLDIGYVQTVGVSYTDLEWTFLPATTANKIYYYPASIYRYLMGREGQTMNPAVMNKSFSQQITVIQSLNRQYDSYPDSDTSKKRYLYRRIMTNLYFIYRNAVLFRYYPMEKVRELDQYIKTWNTDAYNELGNLCMYRSYYKYVNRWRKGQTISPIFRFIHFLIKNLKK